MCIINITIWVYCDRKSAYTLFFKLKVLRCYNYKVASKQMMKKKSNTN